MNAITLPARREPLVDARALGAAVGCLVALACALVTGAEFIGMSLPPEGVGLVSVAAAGTAGWVLGPRATPGTSMAGWVGTTLGMAFITMVLGAVGVGILAGVTSPSSRNGPTELLFGIVALSLLGMLFFGWIAVPILLVPATIWSVIMWIFAGRR